MYVFKILVGDYKKVFHEEFDVFTVRYGNACKRW